MRGVYPPMDSSHQSSRPSAPFTPTVAPWHNSSYRRKTDRDGVRDAQWQKVLSRKGSLTQYTYGSQTIDDGKQIAFICAPHTGLLVIDIDDEHSFDWSLVAGFRPTVRSGGGGYHYYFDARHIPADAWPKQGPIPGGDVKSNGFVPAPGSTHWNGNKYELLGNMNELLNIATPELFDRLHDALQTHKALKREGSYQGESAQGGDDSHMASFTYRLVMQGMTREEVYPLWQDEADRIQDPNYPFTLDDFDRHYGDETRGAYMKYIEHESRRLLSYIQGYEDLAPAEEAKVPEPAVPSEDRFPSIDWKEAYRNYEDNPATHFLTGKWLERAQQMSLIGDGKVGKSVFMWNWCVKAINGEAFLGDEARDPIDVLYFDRENNEREIVRTMISFGYSPAHLKRFDYRLFPRFDGSLNGKGGRAAKELLAIVDEVRPDVVVLDTVSRYITGDENSSETWLSLYQKVHAELKARGVACIRLDHFGKDSGKGARGSSAKTQDVDHAWEMTATSETETVISGETHVLTNIQLTRTHSRTGLGPSSYSISRKGVKREDVWQPRRTSHQLTELSDLAQANAEVEGLKNRLIDAGVPAGYGRDRMKEWAKQQGIEIRMSNQTFGAVVAQVKRHHESQLAQKDD